MKSVPEGISGVLDRILMVLTTFEEVRAVGLFGSHAAGTADPLSDVDVLVIASKAVPHGEERLRQYRAAGLGEAVAFDAEVAGLRRDVVRHGELLLDLHWIDRASAERVLHELTRDFDADEFLPEALLASEALYDAHETLAKLAREVPAYPAERAVHRVRRSLLAAQRDFDVTHRLEKAAVRGDAVAFAAARHDLLQAYLAGLFALNGAWYRPQSRMLERVAAFPRIEEGAVVRVESVLLGLGTGADLAGYYDDMQKLFSGLASLAKSAVGEKALPPGWSG